MKELFSYLRRRQRALLLLILCGGIFCLTFWLYGLPLEAVAYPGALSLLLLLGFGMYDYLKALQKHRSLSALAAFQAEISPALLPAPESPIEDDYRQMITRLVQEQNDLKNDLNLRYQSMVDYYTVWAHQIKTPIASMKLNLQGEDFPAARQISADLLRTEQYVDMVMTYLRLESDSSDYVIRRCDLDVILRGAVRKFAGEFILRKLRLSYEPLHAAVLTDEKWISFVVEQVLSNALKYTPSGGISITMEPGQELCIRDSGMGIASEDLPRIFEKGFTGCNGRADKQASGIGLYLCRQICTRLGHSIRAESEPAKGTAIFIGLAEAALEVE